MLVHIEVQANKDTSFAKRMYVYNYRIFDRYDRKVVSLAVLADRQETWRPSSYGYKLWGCKVGIEFPVVKIMDHEKRWNELEQSPNPFAVIVMSHLKAQATYQDAQGRLQWKFGLFKMLYNKGYSREMILNLFQFIDWLLILPEELERTFLESVRQYEEEIKMPYVTSVERLGIKQGIQQGIQQGVQQGIKQGIKQGVQQGIKQGILQTLREGIVEILEVRFENVPDTMASIIADIDDLSILKMLHKKAATAISIEAFESILNESQDRD